MRGSGIIGKHTGGYVDLWVEDLGFRPQGLTHLLVNSVLPIISMLELNSFELTTSCMRA